MSGLNRLEQTTATGQQIELDFFTRLNAQVLQDFFSESDLPA